MCLTGGKIAVALVTAHVAFADVPRLLTTAEIVRVGRLFANFLARRGNTRVRIAVAALKPHAGEGGDLGSEETEIIAPAVQSLQERGPPTRIFRVRIRQTPCFTARLPASSTAFCACITIKASSLSNFMLSTKE